jgi:hypothetical protein
MADYVARFSITGEDIKDIWKKHSERYTGSLGRIDDARALLIGEKRAPLPDVIAKRPDGEAFRVDTAQKYTATMQLVNMLADPIPRLKRPKLATSDLGETVASRVEKFINPSVDRVMSHRDVIELLTVEAEMAALVVPDVARWRKVAGDYYEKDGATIKAAFQRDSAGKTLDDAVDFFDGDEEKAKGSFTSDEGMSRKAYEKHVRNLRARNFPCDVELLSRQQMVPLNPRIKGDDVMVDGIITKTRMNASTAMKNWYQIDGLNDHLEPTDEDEGDQDSGDLWLYMYVGSDQDQWTGELYPYFAYSLAGKATSNQRAGFEDHAVIDLRKTCGMSSLPVVYGYGLRWFTVNPDKRAMPYTFPFGRSWLATDAFLTGKAYAGWSEGMLAWFMRMPDTVTNPAMQQAWMEFVKDNPLVIEPFKILPVWGEMIPAQHPGTGRDVGEMVQALQGSNSSELVNPLARGGGDAASAIERSVVTADTVAGVSDIRNTARNVRRRVGEKILEVCAGISRIYGRDVLIYGNPETPTDENSATRAIIELKARWLGPEDEESFDLEAYYPKSLGDNLAEKAQVFGFYQNNAITFEQWCDEIGVADPERYRAQLLFDQWIKTPSGMQVAMKDAAEYLGDKELVALFGAQKSGAAGPQGQPMGMLAGLTPPTGGGQPGGSMDAGAQAAVGVQNPAQSQYAAIVGAGRQADATTAQPGAPMGQGMAPGAAA